MSVVQYNYVYRQGAAANAPVPSFYTCLSTVEVTSPIEGDTAYEFLNKQFMKYDGTSWISIEGTDLESRVLLLEFLVAAIIQKGFGGL